MQVQGTALDERRAIGMTLTDKPVTALGGLALIVAFASRSAQLRDSQRCFRLSSIRPAPRSPPRCICVPRGCPPLRGNRGSPAIHVPLVEPSWRLPTERREGHPADAIDTTDHRLRVRGDPVG